MLQSVLKCLVDVINMETSTLASVAMQALGHIGICTPLPPLVIDSTEGEMMCAGQIFMMFCAFGLNCSVMQFL